MDVIATHVNADFDCLGAMIAAKRIYPDAVLVFPGGQESGLRDFLLQSTLYAYDVKGIRDINLDAVRRLILVDVRSSDRIGHLADIVDRPDLEIHIYDHHPADDHALHGQIEEIHAVGATTTIMAHIFIQRGIHPTADEATMMMLGLYEDTGQMLFPGTTPKDFRAAAFLLEHGANLNVVADFLIREMTPEQVDLLNRLLKSTERITVAGVEIAVASASLDHYIGDISSLIHKMKDIENLDVLIAAVRMEDRIFLIGRSRVAEVHLGELFQEFGGGGHAYAASATVRDLPLVQLLEQLETLLPKHVRSAFEARDLMSHPVKTLAVDATIDAARELMARFSFNAVPVVDQEAQVVGIITRQVVEKAAYHKLKKMLVGEVMNSDFEVVDIHASLDAVQQGIIEHNQRCVPVVDNHHLVGVITRTDLLRHMLGDRQDGKDNQGVYSSRTLQMKRKSLRRLIEAQLPTFLKDLMSRLGEVADRSGVRAFLVGGFVRDLLLRHNNLDIDLVIEGDGIAFAKKFAKTMQCRVREHEKFGTAVIIFPNGFKIDIASARLEYYDSPAALPNVEHASIRHDLYRRDFTINTLTIALNRENYGQMIDFFGGQRDIKDKSIRVLHNLSFIEDPTRLFRAVRFEQRLGFRIGRQTERLMRSAVHMGLVKKVGGARIMHELKQILDEPQVVAALKRLDQFELLKSIDSQLRFELRTTNLLMAAEKACSWFDLLYTGEKYRRWVVYLLCLLDRMSEKGVERIVSWLGLHPRDHHLFIVQRLRSLELMKVLRQGKNGSSKPCNSDIYHWFHGFDLEIVLYLMARSDSDRLRQWISLFVTELRKVNILLSGQDLIACGFSPGPQFQKIFRALLDERLNGHIHTREDELKLVKNKFASN
ncbi:MAG: CBS domain-containing protein [Desulfuromonadales bacterium]|nr:CBS domain-containing protein [Desulfuromonadales bacterium]